MRSRALISEICRDVASGTSRTVGLWSALSMVVVCLTLADAFTVTRLIESARKYRASGAATLTIVAPRAIDGAACEALNGVPGVQAAGALRQSDSSLTLATLPSTPVPLYQVSRTFASVLDAQPSALGGVYFPQDVLLALGTTPGAPIVTDKGNIVVAGIYAYSEDGRRPGFAWAALAPSPSSASYDECWASAWPQLPELRQLLLNTISADAGVTIDNSTVQVNQLNARFGSAFSGAAEYRHRVSLLVPALSAIAGVLLALVSVRTRRLELAARLHDGARRQDLHWLVLVENLSWSVPTFLVATVSGLTVAVRVAAPDQENLVVTASATALAAVLGVVLGGAAGVSGLREACLFTYFKDR